MQVDSTRLALYQTQAPELLEAVVSGEAEHVMRRDLATDYCVKFEAGLCSIHKTRSTEFLGDACHFYPRITRQFGNSYTQSASLSCPEITRLALYGETPFVRAEVKVDRLPVVSQNYLSEELNAAQASSIMRAFLDACEDEKATAESVLMQIVSAAHSLHHLSKKDWADATPFTLKMAGLRLPPAEIDFSDGYHLIQILEALIGASKSTLRPRLDAIRQSILQALNISITANNYEIMSRSGDFTLYQKLWKCWQPNRLQMQPILKRWLQAQLTMAGFPFSGFGRDLIERATIIAVRFATLRLALMCAPSLEQAEVIRIVQSLSRFMDHLADPELSMLAYKELKWHSLSRLRGLVLDV